MRSGGIANRLGLDPREFVGVAVLVVGTLLWVLAFTGGLSTLFGSNTKTVKADFASVEDIVPNDPVRIHGVQVGSVASVAADPGGRGGTVTMNIDTGDPIYRDAGASILWRTALGANDAIAIDPGTRASGLLGGATLPQSQDSNQVELDQITQAFRDGAQSGLRTMLQQLGPAFASHPDLAGDLNTLARIAPTAAVGVGALRGQVQDTDLRDLVRNAGQAAQAVTVGTGGSQTRQFVASAGTALSAISASQPTLSSAVSNLSRTLIIAGQSLPSLDANLGRLDPLITKLMPEVPQIAPTLQQLHPTLVDADALLRDATPLLNRLRPAVHSLASSATVGVPVLNGLAPSLVRLQRTILPGLNETTPETRGHPAYTLIGGTITNLGSLASFIDGDGGLANLTLGLGAANDTGGVLPCTIDFTGTDLLVCNTLSQTLGELFTGGTSLLSSLVSRPGAAPIYSPLLAKARTLQSHLDATVQALLAKAPAAAKYLLQPNHGAGR